MLFLINNAGILVIYHVCNLKTQSQTICRPPNPLPITRAATTATTSDNKTQQSPSSASTAQPLQSQAQQSILKQPQKSATISNLLNISQTAPTTTFSFNQPPTSTFSFGGLGNTSNLPSGAGDILSTTTAASSPFNFNLGATVSQKPQVTFQTQQPSQQQQQQLPPPSFASSFAQKQSPPPPFQQVQQQPQQQQQQQPTQQMSAATLQQKPSLSFGPSASQTQIAAQQQQQTINQSVLLQALQAQQQSQALARPVVVPTQIQSPLSQPQQQIIKPTQQPQIKPTTQTPSQQQQQQQYQAQQSKQVQVMEKRVLTPIDQQIDSFNRELAEFKVKVKQISDVIKTIDDKLGRKTSATQNKFNNLELEMKVIKPF